MALTVETGAGLSNADTYVSLADFKTYCIDHNLDLTGITDPVLEAALRNAANYIDGAYRFRGIKGSADQAREFPRAAGAVDRDGLVIAAVPQRLKTAQCELAFIGTVSDLLPASTTGIKSESVGPISVTYSDAGVPSQPVYPAVTNTLRPLVRLDAMPAMPISTGPTSDPFFGVTLHDSKDGPIPGATPEETSAET